MVGLGSLATTGHWDTATLGSRMAMSVARTAAVYVTMLQNAATAMVEEQYVAQRPSRLKGARVAVLGMLGALFLARATVVSVLQTMIVLAIAARQGDVAMRMARVKAQLRVM